MSRQPRSSLSKNSVSSSAWRRNVWATSPRDGCAVADSPAERRGEVAEQPRATEASATDDDAVAAGLGDHAQRVVGGPDVAVAEHRHGRDRLLELGDGRPVGLAGVELGRGARVQRDRRDARALGDAPGLEVGEVVGVDALAHLDGERDVARGAHGALDDVAEQAALPRQRRSPALARDLGHGASEVQVDVVGAVFGDEHRDGLGDGLRVDAVELDRARRLGLVVRDEPHRLGRALDEGARRDHLADVEARRRTRGRAAGTPCS